ncbi:MAG: RNA pseudouridine synthase, partial [Deltaproteobacteria bacterium]
LIDDGLVFAHGKKLKLARGLIDARTNFKVNSRTKPSIIYEDANLIVCNKPYAMDSYMLERQLKAKLIHRLDKTTSGLIALAKNEDYRAMVLEEFKKNAVYKEYLCVVKGVVAQELSINSPISTQKGKRAKSFIDPKGKEALSIAKPLAVDGKKTLLSVVIKTGRTHQIRVHLASAGLAIVGDELYGGVSAKRLFLHSYKLSFLNHSFECKPEASFWQD